MSKLTENQLITKNTQCLHHLPNRADGHRSGLMTFKFTQLLFLADRDIVYCGRLER